MKRMILVAVALLLLAGCRDCFGATLGAQGTLQWEGQPTSDGSATWPAELLVDLGPTFDTANVSLLSMPYSGFWMTADDGMTSSTSRFFSSSDGLVQVELEMDPLGSLSDLTLEDITNVHFEWAHPAFNAPEAPTSWLEMSGPAAIVPEPAAARLLTVLGVLGLAFRLAA